MMNPLNDPVQSIQGLSALRPAYFSMTSRYSGIDIVKLETTEGKTIAYIQRRFIPSPSRFHLLQEHLVTQGDRLDNITYQYLGDAEQFWRLCDANRAMHPEDLTAVIGRRLRITLPEGIPGTPHA